VPAIASLGANLWYGRRLAAVIFAAVCAMPVLGTRVQPNEIDKAGAEIVELAKKQHCQRVLVADLLGPDQQINELGRQLADELSLAIAKAGPGLQLVPRVGNTATQQDLEGSLDGHPDGNLLGQKDLLEGKTVAALAHSAKSDMVITGELTRTADNNIKIALRVWAVPPAANSGAELSAANHFAPIDLKVPMTPERAAVMTHSLAETPVGAFRLSAGMGRIPRSPSGAACLDCPPPWNVTKDAKVKLLVTVNTEGRVTTVELTETSDEKIVKDVIAAVRKWRFQPARGTDGLPTTVQVPVVVNTRWTNPALRR
jgi:TonB family protein